MKKLFVMLVVMTAMIALLSGSVNAQMKIDKGIKFGLNLAKFTGADSEGADTRTAFGGGVFFTINATPQVAIQIEALYMMKGATDSFVLEDIPVDVTMKQDYLEIPVLVKFKFPTEGNFKPAFYAGPAVGFKVSSKMKLEALGESAATDIDNAKSTEFSLVFGAGADVAMEAFNLVFDARYTMGLTKVYEDVAVDDVFVMANDDGTAPDIKNGTFSIMVGFGF